MKVSVTNLGAIKEATVELGGLTVFVGPNGTGKSYLAKVLYGLQRHETMTSSCTGHAQRFYPILFGKNIDTAEEALAYLQKLSPDSLRQAIPAIANLHAELFQNRLGGYFNDDCDLFVKTTITFSELDSLSDQRLQSIIDSALDYLDKWPKPQKINTEQILGVFCSYLFWGMGGGLADYFPAARSNFMLTYKALYRARADEHVGLEAISDKLWIPSKGGQTRKTGTLGRFDRPTEDFISHLYDLDSTAEGPLSSIAASIQAKLYGKDKILVEQPEGALPSFRYQVKNAKSKIQLHLSSSMVTETSPLLIGFRHWVKDNSLVIIDEPESHLHPEAQRALVNGLAEAVNQGLRVILITHSPYILSCVNNLIKFGRLIKNFPDDKDLSKLKKEHPDLVALEKTVHAYHFGLDGIVKDIVLPSGLIDEAEFTEPFDRINDLYEAMRDIEWEHRQ